MALCIRESGPTRARVQLVDEDMARAAIADAGARATAVAPLALARAAEAPRTLSIDSKAFVLPRTPPAAPPQPFGRRDGHYAGAPPGVSVYDQAAAEAALAYRMEEEAAYGRGGFGGFGGARQAATTHLGPPYPPHAYEGGDPTGGGGAPFEHHRFGYFEGGPAPFGAPFGAPHGPEPGWGGAAAWGSRVGVEAGAPVAAAAAPGPSPTRLVTFDATAAPWRPPAAGGAQ